jgi:uroporphyrinogen decarboxylase
MKFDGRHSYEDNITPVEKAYPELHKKIAVLGGIDVDFITRKTPEEVYNRSKNLIEMSSVDGSYALGTGNSIADYIPVENYFAMTKAVLEYN